MKNQHQQIDLTLKSIPCAVFAMLLAGLLAGVPASIHANGSSPAFNPDDAQLIQCSTDAWGEALLANAPNNLALIQGAWGESRSTTSTRNATMTVAPLRIDIAPPDGQFAIDAGAARTTDTQVNLTLAAEDGLPWGWGVARMRLSNDGRQWSPWMAWAPTLDWTLAGSPGANTVYVQLRDRAGNDSKVLIQTILFGIPSAIGRNWSLYR